MVSKQDAERFMKMEGHVKGTVFQTDAKYINKTWGQDGLRKVQAKLAQLGCPIDYENAKALQWYPLGLRPLSLMTIQETFNLSNDQMKTMGYNAPKFSFLVKLIAKFFISPKMTVEQAPGFWDRHWDKGKLESEYNEKENYAIVKISDFELPPVGQIYLEGYFQRIMELSVGKPVVSKQTESGEKTFQYKLTW